MNLNNEKIIDKIKNRDHDLIHYLFEKYHDHLFKGAIKQGLNTDQAETVVADTWSTFFEKIENFKGNSHIRTYLFGIMFNKVKEVWRSNKKYTHDFDQQKIETLFNEQGSHNTTPQDPRDWLQSNQTLEIIAQALEKLPEKQRMAFILKEVEGESTNNICKILDVSSTNLGVLIYRAKNSLRLLMEDYFKDE